MAERQIYVMITKPFCRRCKVGISYNSHKRDREVTKSTGKNMGLLIVLPFMFAYFWEQLIHGLLFWAASPVRGNGGTEFYIGLVTPIAMLLVITCFIIEKSIIILVIGAVVLVKFT